MTELRLYRQLSTRSRRAIRRKNGRFGRPYDYRPRGNLLARLANANSMPVVEVYAQLLREREILLREGG